MTTAATKTCPQCGVAYGGDLRFCPTDGTSLRSSTGDLIGHVVAERYHVERMLGEGGMGRVYLAEHVKMGRKSALKVMSPSMMHDADAIGRFTREAANASRISHPNVAAIYDFGETPDGLIYLAMEYVDGVPLTRMLEGGALPVERASKIARQIADALEAAHELGIVHRDLKPDNVMIARARDGGDLVKVVDFGIAKAPGATAQTVTRTGLVVGTPEYMSPEQLSGDPLDARSDVYALGLVTFAMLSGALPFQATSQQEAMLKRLTERPRTLAEVRPEVGWPAALQRVLDRALARNREERYARASDFASDLARSVSGASVAVPIDAAATEVVSPLAPTRESRESAPPRTVKTAARRARPFRRVMLLGTPVVIVVTLIALGLADRGSSASRSTPRLAPRDSAALAAIANGSKTAVTPVTNGTSRVEPMAREVRSEKERESGMGNGESATPNRASSRQDPFPIPQSPVPLTARQSAQILEKAQEHIDNGDPGRALLVLQHAIGRLPSRSDSVRAFYHVGEALLKQGKVQRGCEVLRSIAGDRAGGYSRSASSLYDSQCH